MEIIEFKCETCLLKCLFVKTDKFVEDKQVDFKRKNVFFTFLSEDEDLLPFKSDSNQIKHGAERGHGFGVGGQTTDRAFTIPVQNEVVDHFERSVHDEQKKVRDWKRH